MQFRLITNTNEVAAVLLQNVIYKRLNASQAYHGFFSFFHLEKRQGRLKGVYIIPIL